MERRLGIYLHIPFCRSKCAYCDFCSTAACDGQTMDAYLEALCRQIEAWLPEGCGREVDTVYIGGGTPSVFGGARLTALLDEFLESLPEAEWKLFCGRYWHNIPVGELATIHGIPAKTVSMRLFRTREKLRLFLNERGYSL